MKKKRPAIEQRINYLEEIEAIKKLKYGYADGCDDIFCRNKVESLLNLFTSNAVWDVGEFGKYSGKKEIEGCLREIRKTFIYAMHYFMNPRIEVNGKRANGRWYMLAIYTNVEARDIILAGSEDDQYKKVNGQWLVSHMKLNINFQEMLST